MNNDLLFIVVVIALCLFLVVAERVQKQVASSEVGNLSAPARRKVLAARGRERFWKLAATGLALSAIVLISAEIVYARVAQAIPPAEAVSIGDGELRLPVSKLADHALHRFAVGINGHEVGIIAILDASDTVRAALDACAICGAQGYYQQGQNVICRNCGAAINLPTIGHAGGCNPIPFDPPYKVDGDTLVISQAALDGAAGHFLK